MSNVKGSVLSNAERIAKKRGYAPRSAGDPFKVKKFAPGNTSHSDDLPF